MLENITFKMNLVSRLAAADCASDVAGNTDIREHTCTIIYHQQDPDNMDVLEVIFPKKGSLFFKNTSPYSRTQYFPVKWTQSAVWPQQFVRLAII